MLTVNDLLHLEPFKEFKMISGFEGIHNRISSVNIMDNPNALDWFAPEEVLISSGYFFKDDENMQEKILRQLKLINCPALIIKPFSYLGKVPDNMLTLSNELQLPIIEMPYGMSFSKVMTRVMEELSENYNALNRKSLDIHNEFFELTLHGGGLQKIADVLSTMLEASIFLCDENWKILNAKVISSYAKTIHDNHADKISLPQSVIDSLTPKFEVIQKPIVRLLEFDHLNIPCIVVPVFFNEIHYGFIIVLEFHQQLRDHHYIALENSCMAFAMEQTHLAEMKRTQNQIQENFFDDLLVGNITSIPSLKNLANLQDINLNLMYTAIVFNVAFEHANVKNTINNLRYEENILKNLMDQLKKKPFATLGKCYVFQRKKQIIMLIGTTSEDSLQQSKTILADFIDAMKTKYPKCTIRCGIGNLSKQLADVHTSFFEAQETLRLMDNEPIKKKVRHYNDFFISHFFKKNIDYEELVLFFSKTLGPLYDFDLKNNSHLIETLECWISNKLNVAETARQLYIHRNSLLYRIEKIQSILVSDFKDSEELLKIQIAIKIYYILRENNTFKIQSEYH